MISDGIDALKNRGFLLAAEPTGIGKTAAALASALNAANQSENPEIPKIMFLTGRQSQHRIVVDTIRDINKRLPSGFSRVKVVDIIGRESMCKSAPVCANFQEFVQIYANLNKSTQVLFSVS